MARNEVKRFYQSPTDICVRSKVQRQLNNIESSLQESHGAIAANSDLVVKQYKVNGLYLNKFPILWRFPD